MYRFNRIKSLALCLAVLLLAGCTAPSDITDTNNGIQLPPQASDHPLVEKLQKYLYREMPSGDIYDYSYGKEVSKASFPPNYHSAEMEYNSVLVTDLPETDHEVSVYLPFEKDTEELYLVSDKEVSARIVDRITTQALALVGTGCPDMRGKAVYDGMTLESEWVDAYPYNAVNNVLTFDISRNLRYKADGEMYSRYVFTNTYMVFDLNTGDLVPLAAVFVDGYDYITRLNEKVREYILEKASESDNEYGGFSMLAPFTSIRADQPFFITTDSLVLIMDHENSEFALSDAQLGIPIPLSELSDCLAIFDRYDTEESIYATEKINIVRVLTADANNATSVTEDFSEPDKYYYSVMTFGAPQLPKEVEEAFETYKKNTVLSVSNYKIMADADIENGDLDTCRSYYADITPRIAGDYGVLTIGAIYDGFAGVETPYTQDAFCFNIKENRPAAIGDYFTKGFDYVGMLDEYFRSQEHFSEMYEYIESVSVLVNEEPQSATKPIPKNTIILTPDQRGFMFNVNLSEDGVLGEMYDDFISLSGFIRYSEIGYENLTLFS